MPSPHGGFAGKSTADRSPNFEEYPLHCKNSIHIPKSRYQIDCTLTYCASNECHHHRRKERRWEKASHAFGVSRLQFPPECFLPCPTLTRRVCRSVHFSRVSPLLASSTCTFPGKKMARDVCQKHFQMAVGIQQGSHPRWTH